MSSVASSASASVKYSSFLSSLSIALQSANSQAIIGGRQLNLHRAAFNIKYSIDMKFIITSIESEENEFPHIVLVSHKA
jgi:hypothetical protein